jgi:hypothetical protein
MPRTVSVLVAGALVAGLWGAPVLADPGFHPLRTVRAAANLGLNTAKRAVDLGLDTAAGAVDVAKDAVTLDNCRPGARYKGSDGRWHECH